MQANTDPNNLNITVNNETFALPMSLLPQILMGETEEVDETTDTNPLIANNELDEQYCIAQAATGGAIPVDEQNAGILAVYGDTFVREQYFGDVVNVIQAQRDDADAAEKIVFQTAVQQQLQTVPALTSETNAVMPIMSTLEQPSKTDRLSPNSSLDLVAQNLDESLAVIGVTAHTNIPTSLELPITITNPAIAPKSSANPISMSPIYASANGSALIGLTASASSPLVASVSDADQLGYDLFNTTTQSQQLSPNSIDMDSNSDIVPVTPEPINDRHSPEIRGFPSAADINDDDNVDSNSSGEIPLQSNLVSRQQTQQEQLRPAQRHRNNHFIVTDGEHDDVADNVVDNSFLNDHHQYIVDEQSLGNAVTFTGSFNNR